MMGADFCFLHNPEVKEQRDLAVKKGALSPKPRKDAESLPTIPIKDIEGVMARTLTFMTPRLTKKQHKFAKEYLDTGNATEAADRAYKPQNRATARAIGSENLTKPNIRAFLEERAEDAASMIYQLSQMAKNENVRLNASKEILTRSGYADAPKSVPNLKHEITEEERKYIHELFSDL